MGNPKLWELKLPLPILIPLHAYADHLRRFGDGDDARKATLATFISDYLIRRQAGLGLPEEFFERLLLRGHSCVLLLDGLDEVPDEKTRVRVSRAVEDLVNAAPQNPVIVTSRPAAYEGEAVLSARFRRLDLLPMTPEQVKQLVTRLYRAAISNEEERERETAALLDSIDNLEKLRARQGAVEQFITTPLLVRMIVIVHFSGRRLPEQRADLYREVVDVLIRASYHLDANVGLSLAEMGGSFAQQRNLLGVLAFHMHSKGDRSRVIAEDELRSTLVKHLIPQEGREQAIANVNAFVIAARQRGSCLDERSGQYQFLYFGFQEFLAARHLAETLRDVDRMAEFLEDGRLGDPWWREPALLLTGYLSSTSPEVAWALARRLARLQVPAMRDSGWPKLGEQERLAGAALAAASILEQPNAPLTLRRELADLLAQLLASGKGPREWAANGDTLARLGDLRPGVGVRTQGSPDIDWCEIPAGPFIMGSDEVCSQMVDDSEMPLATLDLALYRISRFPVTMIQYARFVEDGGYTKRRYWTPAGWAWRTKNEVFEPETYGGTFNLSNHPAVGISWYEAVAYCCWMSDCAGMSIRLPTEAEWEKAARGVDGRVYPWGDVFSKTNCNIVWTGLGATSSVGLFAGGASYWGVMDLSGNVWEWTSSLYHAYPYRRDDGRENLDLGGPRVLRGGSWKVARDLVRCAYRGHYPVEQRSNKVGFRMVLARDSSS